MILILKKIKIENKQWNVKKIFLLNAEQKKSIICKLLEDNDKTERQQNEVKTYQTLFKKRTSEKNNLCNENLENIQFEQIKTLRK